MSVFGAENVNPNTAKIHLDDINAWHSLSIRLPSNAPFNKPSDIDQGRYPINDPTMLRHLEAACYYGCLIEQMAKMYSLLPSVILGLGSRQSGWGLAPAPSGMRDDKVDRASRQGLILMDDEQNDEGNVEAACRIVQSYRSHFRGQTNLQGQGLLRASLAAFDCGVRSVLYAVRQGLDVDSPTSDRRFGRDVLERAEFFQTHGWD